MFGEGLIDFEVDEKHEQGWDEERACGGIDRVARQIQEGALPHGRVLLEYQIRRYSRLILNYFFRCKEAKSTCFHPSRGAREIKALNTHTNSIISPAVRLFLNIWDCRYISRVSSLPLIHVRHGTRDGPISIQPNDGQVPNRRRAAENVR